MVPYKYNTKQEFLHNARPHKGTGLRRNSPATMWGFALIIKEKNYMKKFLHFALLAILLVPSLSLASFDVSLKYGSSGTSVKEMQEFLTDQGVYTGPITGKFYALTLKAVKKWQSANNLPASGFFGSQSRAKANELLALGDSDAAETLETGTISNPVTYKPFDACKNIDGIQSVIPDSMFPSGDGDCSVIQNNTQIYTPNPTNTYTPPTSNFSQEYTNKLNVLYQQITDIKNKYYIDVQNVDKTAGFAAQANGLKQKLLIEANLKIDQINAQIQLLYSQQSQNVTQNNNQSNTAITYVAPEVSINAIFNQSSSGSILDTDQSPAHAKIMLNTKSNSTPAIIDTLRFSVDPSVKSMTYTPSMGITIPTTIEPIAGIVEFTNLGIPCLSNVATGGYNFNMFVNYNPIGINNIQTEMTSTTTLVYYSYKGTADPNQNIIEKTVSSSAPTVTLVDSI